MPSDPNHLIADIESIPPHLVFGRVTGVQGLLVEVAGIERHLSVGARCNIVARGERADPAPGPPAPVAPEAAWLQPTISGLQQLVDNTAARLREFADSYGDQRLKRKPWTRKEALGHLIEWAMVHHQWLTWALMESKLRAAGYPDEAAVAVQHYSDFPWAETVDLWVSLNKLLIHALLRIPSRKLNVSCWIGIAEPVSLAKLIDAYSEYCEEIVGQILARLD